MIAEAYVNGMFHTMLFGLDNYSMDACETEPGRYFVLKLE
jgi:hypothetical protein